MNEFEIWILKVLNSLPSLEFYIPDFVYTYLRDICMVINCFVDFSYFVPLLELSVVFSFFNILIALSDYVKSYFGSTKI